MTSSYSIDLTKNKSFYHFTTADLPQDITADATSEKAKGEIEERIVQLTQNGGFLIVPSSQLIQSETEQTLKKSANRQQILKNIVSDKPTAGLLGLISFKRDTIDKIQTLNIEPSKTLDIDEDYLEETLTIELAEGLDSSFEDLDLDLILFGLDPTKAKGIEDTTAINNSDKKDVISEAVFYNDAGKEIHREFLIPETVQDLSKNNTLVNLNNKGHSSTSSKKPSKKKRGLIKKIKIVIRKLAGKIRQIITELKDFGIDYIIKGLKQIVRNPYKILKYDTNKKKFFECTVADIAVEKRTLLFLHGTLKGSFDGLFKKKNNTEGSFKYLYNFRFKNHKHWFDYLLNQTERAVANPIEQIITLEHETLLDDPEENVRFFFDDLGLKNLVFQKPVAVVAASRGNLFARQLSISPSVKNMPIDRVAIISGGYSDYFCSTQGVKQYVNSLTKLFPINQPLTLLLSLSLDILFKLPGLAVQSKDHDGFKALVKQRNQVCYFNMTNNYKPSKSKEKILKKLADHFLGKENDLALSVFAQKDHRPGYMHPNFPDFSSTEKHGDALKVQASKQALFYFLTDPLDLPKDQRIVTV